jgi:hypothetical protein
LSRSAELLAALVTVFVVSVLYTGGAAALGVPPASGPVGHGVGVIGFVLMLLTEIGYSTRKRSTGRLRGTMRSWLRFHIYTGIVGPYLVLLHAAWHFNGLAGLLMLMVAMVVASGFIGRYIYTAVPRTADGAIIEAAELNQLVTAARLEAAAAHTAGATRDPDAVRREATAQRRLRELQRQMASLRWARRALATWHTFHIPLGVAMFVTAFAHIAGALYFATLSP